MPLPQRASDFKVSASARNPNRQGPQLRRTLFGHVGDDARRLDDAAEALAECHDRTRAEAAARAAETLPAEAQAGRRRHPGAEVPTDEVGLHRPPDPSAERDQVGDG
jgi:hypothetical protein